MFVALHLYSSDSGCHDTRIFLGDRGDIPPWSHLRPQHQSLVHPNSYLNKLSLREWQQLFESEMPGSQVFASCDAGDEARKILNDLRAKGELENYSDEELLTVTLEISWRKTAEVGEEDGNSHYEWRTSVAYRVREMKANGAEGPKVSFVIPCYKLAHLLGRLYTIHPDAAVQGL